MLVNKFYVIHIDTPIETYIRYTNSTKWKWLFYAEDVFGMGYLADDVMHNDVKKFTSLKDAKDFVEERYDRLGTFSTCPKDTEVTNVFIMTVEVQVDISTRI